jgi:hypothetical protein
MAFNLKKKCKFKGVKERTISRQIFNWNTNDTRTFEQEPKSGLLDFSFLFYSNSISTFDNNTKTDMSNNKGRGSLDNESF